MHLLYIYIDIDIDIDIYIYIYRYMYIYIIRKRSITPQHIKYDSKLLSVVQSLYFDKLPRFISTFLTKAAGCQNIEIVLHLITLSYIYVYMYAYV